MLAVTLLAAAAVAQWTRDPGGRSGRGGFGARGGRGGVPDWENDAELPHDKFTFARIQYSGYGRGFGGWRVDYPNADLNFSHRLEQLTAIKTDPDGTVVNSDRGFAERVSVRVHHRPAFDVLGRG